VTTRSQAVLSRLNIGKIDSDARFAIIALGSG
jgi:hypothetical protein